jgi:hydroxymethylbilane synthase
MLKIGVKSSQLAHWQARSAQAELEQANVQSEVVVFAAQKTEDALLRGDADVAVCLMQQLPTEFPSGLLIAATSRRYDPSDWLVIRPDAVEHGKIFRFRHGASVSCSDTRRSAQLLDFRPDAHIDAQPGDLIAQLAQLRSDNTDALLLSAFEVEQLGLDVSGFEVIKLNPREFVPRPGQGVLAWLALRDDLPTRRILQQIHRPETSACTNIERRVLQLLPDTPKTSAGVFCERDSAGYFHCYAACQTGETLRRTRISQSISGGLAEKIVAGMGV